MELPPISQLELPVVSSRTLVQILLPLILHIHIPYKKSYSDKVYNFTRNKLWREYVLDVGYKKTSEDPQGKHGLNTLTDLFKRLSGRLDIFSRICIDVPEDRMQNILSGNHLGLIETDQLDATIRLDDAFSLREFRWSGNLDLLKDRFQIPFSQLTSLGLRRCRITLDDATILLSQCHDLQQLEIGTLIPTEYEPQDPCKMPMTLWPHFKLRCRCLESLTITSECSLLDFTSKLALNDPRLKSNLRTLSLTLLTQNASRHIYELDFPWPQLETVDIVFQLGVIPSATGLCNDLIHKSRLPKSVKLTITEYETIMESPSEAVNGNHDELNAVVQDASNFLDRGERGSMSELDGLDISTEDGGRVFLLNFPVADYRPLSPSSP